MYDGLYDWCRRGTCYEIETTLEDTGVSSVPCIASAQASTGNTNVQKTTASRPCDTCNSHSSLTVDCLDLALGSLPVQHPEAATVFILREMCEPSAKLQSLGPPHSRTISLCGLWALKIRQGLEGIWEQVPCQNAWPRSSSLTHDLAFTLSSGQSRNKHLLARAAPLKRNPHVGIREPDTYGTQLQHDQPWSLHTYVSQQDSATLI